MRGIYHYIVRRFYCQTAYFYGHYIDIIVHFIKFSIGEANLPDFLPFILFVLVATFTPGPNNIMALTKASKQGKKSAFAFNIGVFGGFFVIMMLSSLFSSALFNYIPKAKPYLSYLGALYILFLAYKVFKSGYMEQKNESRRVNGFIQGVLMQFINPKAILFGLTVVVTFIAPYYDSIFIFIGYSIGLAGVAFIATSCWAMFGSLFSRIMQKHQKILNAIMALLLVYAAVSLIL
ncbi:MAG: LysE family transporter [Clostridia bacterium]|nr:LysE family transporter [Clostridia bacterium]